MSDALADRARRMRLASHVKALRDHFRARGFDGRSALIEARAALTALRDDGFALGWVDYPSAEDEYTDEPFDSSRPYDDEDFLIEAEQ